MENNLESILQSLRLGCMDEADLKLVIKRFLDIHKTDYIDRNRCIVAQTFEELLRQIQHYYFEEEPLSKIELNNSDVDTLSQISNFSTESDLNSILTDVVLIFSNIEHIPTSASIEEQTDGSICLLRFLSFLKQHNSVDGDDDFTDINEIKDILSIISEDLEKIRFLFDYKIENNALFPIDKLLVGIISNSQFLTQNRRINEEDYYALKLAVRFFKKESDEERIVEEIRNYSNLRFIDYLNQDSELIDTPDMINYQKNRVMVFWNSLKKSVLIRNDSDDYFNINTDIDYKIEHEYTKDRRVQIGSFVEIRYSKNDNATNLIDLMKDFNRRKDVLRLFFKEGRNIFLPGIIRESDDGQLHTINPFTKNDPYIIKEKEAYFPSEISKVFDEYSNLILMKSAVNTMNRVIIGTFTMLMNIDNHSWNNLLDKYDDNDFYQNQMIHRWMASTDSNSQEKVIQTFYKELSYCDSDLEKIRKYEIKPQHFLPVKDDIGKYCNFFIPNDNQSADKIDIVLGTISETPNLTSVFIQGRAEVINNPDIQDTGRFLEIIDRSSVYFLERGKSLFVIDQNLAKALYGLKKSFENCLSFSCAKCVSSKRYKSLVDAISLQKLALLEGAPSIFNSSEVFFAEHAFYRIIHNMIGYGIDNIDKVNAYLFIFENHQLLSFDRIVEDTFFSMISSYTLFVPKDCYAADSVLSQIYDIYLKKHSKRDSNNLYDDILTFNKGKYYRNGKKINEITILFDNFECGRGTVDYICAYLDLDGEDSRMAERIDIARSRIQRYFYTTESGERKEVSLKDIIEKNNCKFSIHSYYGTEVGKEYIDNFLSEQGISYRSTSYFHEIKSTFGNIKEEVDLIFPKDKPLNENNYAVIREFNMTKRNVFPNEMLTDVNKAVTLFVKKKEKNNNNNLIKIQKKFLQIEKVIDYIISNDELNFKNLYEKINFLYEKYEIQSLLDFVNVVKNVNLKKNNTNFERGIIELAVIAFDKYFSQKNLLKDEKGNYALTIISTLPPYIRILVWEKYLQHDFSYIVLDKLVKAYAKNDQMNKVYEILDKNFFMACINEESLEILKEEAELLHNSLVRLPIACDMKSAYKNYKSLMQNVSLYSTADPEFISIMNMVFVLIK